MSGLSARGVSVRLSGREVLPELDFELPMGRVTVIVGPNACGKSTLLRTLARLVRPERGALLLDGQDMRQLPTGSVARRLGLLPQSPVAPEGIRVRALVERGRTPHLGPFRPMTPADRRAVDEALTITGLHDIAGRRVANLSGGQRQRVWLALVLAQETDILLLDEPTTFLDLPHQIEVLDLARRLNREIGRTVVMVLHDINLGARVADHMIAMRDGRIVAEGAPQDVVTATTMRALFGLDVMVIDDPMRGTPMIVPA